jgi:hypothetical protein
VAACHTLDVNAARAGLVLLAVVAVFVCAPTASASDPNCPTAAEPEPVAGELVAVAVAWHGGAGFPERCTSATGGRAAEPVAQAPPAGPVAQALVAAPSQVVTPAAKAAVTKKAKPKRKGKKARRGKCPRPR